MFGDAPSRARRIGGRIEAVVYRCCRIDPAREMTWTSYLAAIVVFTAVSIVALAALLCAQAWLPLDAQLFPNLSP